MPRSKTDISFKAFWDAYGLKKDREGAKNVWSRMSERDRRAALAGIAAYREECRRTGIAMMYGCRYLRHRRWEDEIDPQPPTPADTDGLEDMELW
jgi:hypothetical protein